MVGRRGAGAAVHGERDGTPRFAAGGVPSAVRECRLLVDGEERVLGAWDFVHCPAGTEHVFVGAGDGPCVALMAGARTENEQLLYPVSELAGRYGASAEEETPDPKRACARFERSQRGRPAYWDQLPWS